MNPNVTPASTLGCRPVCGCSLETIIFLGKLAAKQTLLLLLNAGRLDQDAKSKQTVREEW